MLNSILLKKLLSVLALISFFGTPVFAAENELYVDEVKSTGSDEIALKFSNEISDVSLEPDEAAFRIESTEHPEDIYDVSFIRIDDKEKNIVYLTLSKNLTIGEEYKIIVLKIQDVLGQIILNGMNSEAYFTHTGETTSSNPFVDNSVVGGGQEEGNTDDEFLDKLIELTNSIPENPVVVDTSTPEENPEAGLGGVALNAGDIENQVDVLAKDNTKLPTTGAEHIILLIGALLIGCLLFVYRYKNI